MIDHILKSRKKRGLSGDRFGWRLRRRVPGVGEGETGDENY
ncbi:MAG: hypothetical protein ABSA46_06800 [Thermodesulfovibrionales bacterium]|jgi:hypothetical protein